MRRQSRVSRPLLSTAVLAGTALLASACSQHVTDTPDMGNATPAVSPAAENPDGQIISLPQGHDAIIDMEVAEGDILGLRTAEALMVGSRAQFENNEQVELGVEKLCGDLTATGGTFVLPCADEVFLIDAQNPSLDTTKKLEESATVAALTTDGELLVGNDQEESLTVYRDGQDPEKFDVAAPSTQLISVPVIDRHDAAVRIWNADTTISDVDYPNNRMGAALRVGLGVAQIAGGEDGLVVASDEMADQIAIYNADDVIRLHMTAPVDKDPWGVAWDSTHSLAWISSLSENSLVGYEISAGVPEESQRFNTVADAQNVVVLENGTLVVASATGDGLQIIENPAS